MIRDGLKEFKGLDHDPDFRWRGTNVTRIENLSDIAFAIALGMLITGVDAPRNIAGLREFLIYIVPTLAGFSVLLGLWNGHYTFFRRYGVADNKIIALNALLIFVVLFMAYPLRFAFDSLFAWLQSIFTDDYTRSLEIGVTSFAVAGEIIAYFSLFYASAFALFALMQGHVLKKADLLGLNAYELTVTKIERFARWGQCLISLLVAGLAWFTPLNAIAAILLSTFGLIYVVARRRYPAEHLKTE